jgi:hypothetical protein
MDNEKKKEKDEVILSHNFIPDWMEFDIKEEEKEIIHEKNEQKDK